MTRGREHDLYTADGPSSAVGSLVSSANVIGLAEGASSQEALTAVKALLESGVRRICVSLEGAFHDPSREQAIKSAIQSQYPDHVLGAVPVLLGSDVSNYGDDMTRTHHALMNAYVHGPLSASLFKAEDDLRTERYDRPLLIGHANGGVARVSKTKALDTLESGPAMGVQAVAYFARHYGLAKVVAFDAGGTTVKVSAIQDGRPLLAREAEVFEISVRARSALISSIALGGGSVVGAEDGRVKLRPESMGAYPGPACYDLGGTEATLTDAFCVLGWLNPDNFLGGARRLDATLARQAIEKHVGEPLGASVEDAAAATAEVAFEAVATAVRELLVQVGWEAKDSVLAAFGGNGGIFASGVAERCGFSRARVFDLGAVLSAFGSSVSDIVHVYERAVNLDLRRDEDLRRLAEEVSAMRAEAERDMRGEGLDVSALQLTLEVEPAGKAGAPPVLAMPAGDLNTDALGKQIEGSTPELLRLRATHPMPSHAPPRREPVTGGGAGPVAERDAAWLGKPGSARVYAWASVAPGQSLQGGAILESEMTTYLVPPGWTFEVDDLGNGELTRG